MLLTRGRTETYSSSESAGTFDDCPEAPNWSPNYPSPTDFDSSLKTWFLFPQKRPTESGDETESITSTISRCATYTKQLALCNYISMVYRVSKLTEEEGEQDEDYGAVVPTETALVRALGILGETFRGFQTNFPLAPATVSFDGGIRIQWMLPDSSVRLVIPGAEGEEEEYIYFELKDEYGTEEASASNLAGRIKWLQRESAYAERLLWLYPTAASFVSQQFSLQSTASKRRYRSCFGHSFAGSLHSS